MDRIKLYIVTIKAEHFNGKIKETGSFRGLIKADSVVEARKRALSIVDKTLKDKYPDIKLKVTQSKHIRVDYISTILD